MLGGSSFLKFQDVGMRVSASLLSGPASPAAGGRGTFLRVGGLGENITDNVL